MKYPIQKKYHTFKERRKKRKKKLPPVDKKVAVPSFFTLMNLFSGFLAIISISDGDLIRGAWLIALAGLFDVFDGLMARLPMPPAILVSNSILYPIWFLSE